MDILTEELVQVAEEVTLTKSVILYNDDVNTFDFVIDTLVDICGHDTVQAEQCAWLVHLKGKCAVKNGSAEKLLPVKTALLDRGLSAVIE
jgi:ATP-dependent Clp protease adaptor protein ClpS